GPKVRAFFPTGRGCRRRARAAPSELFDGCDLDEELLASTVVEVDFRDALGAGARDSRDGSLAEVGVSDAVTRLQRQVAIVAHGSRDTVRPLGLRFALTCCGARPRRRARTSPIERVPA